MGPDAPPQRALRGDLDRIRADLEIGDAKLFEMRGPGVVIDELQSGCSARRVITSAAKLRWRI
jgi:hypothetical protein